MDSCNMSCMQIVQRSLSKAQAVPLAGPVVGSSLKALVSLVQIVAGATLTFIFGFLTVITAPCMPVEDENYSIEKSDSIFCQGLYASIGNLLNGCKGLAYSISNAASLGSLGFYIEYVEQDREDWAFGTA